MKTVNLLPSWYLQQQRRQRHFRAHIVIMLLVGGVMIAGVFWSRSQVSEYESKRQTLFAQVSQIGDPGAELARQQANLKRLEDRRSARQELGKTVPMSAILQQIRNEMTTGMALSNVSVDVRPEPVKGSGFVGDARNPPRMRDVAHITVTGIAPKNNRIGEILEKLAKNALFTEVTLDYSRAATLKGYMIEKFGIQMHMDLETLTSADPNQATAGSPAVHPPDSIVSGVPANGH